MVGTKQIKKVSYSKDSITIIYVDGTSTELKWNDINLARVSEMMKDQASPKILRG